jgi:hypothetical protein
MPLTQPSFRPFFVRPLLPSSQSLVFRSFVAAELDTKPVDVKVATKQRAIFVAASLAIFEAVFRLFVEAKLGAK